MALFEYKDHFQYDMEDYFVFEPREEKKEKEYNQQLEFDFENQ